jgi:group I intron endonuclease
MKGKIYKIINKQNEKVYIGCTIHTLKRRFDEHRYRCLKTDISTKLYNSMRKYGTENFEIELIEECDLNRIYETEKKYIEKYDSYNTGLNSTFGGEGCLGYTHSPEIRKKISENTKNGNSHRGKTYEDLYGDKAKDEKEKRSSSVKSGWEKMTKEEKEERLRKTRETLQKKSKHGVELIREIKQKLKDGFKVKELKKLYPQLGENYLYSIQNGSRWSNIN